MWWENELIFCCYLKSVFIRTNLPKLFSTEVHIFCPIDFIDFNRAENVNFYAKRFWQVHSYKKQTLVNSRLQYVNHEKKLNLLSHYSTPIVFWENAG